MWKMKMMQNRDVKKRDSIHDVHCEYNRLCTAILFCFKRAFTWNSVITFMVHVVSSHFILQLKRFRKLTDWKIYEIWNQFSGWTLEHLRVTGDCCWCWWYCWCLMQFQLQISKKNFSGIKWKHLYRKWRWCTRSSRKTNSTFQIWSKHSRALHVT